MEADYEQVFPSTTWKQIRVRVHPAPAARTQQRRRRFRWIGCYRWPKDEWLTIRVKYTGGPECWYYVEARGRHGAFPGSVWLHDAIGEVMAIL